MHEFQALDFLLAIGTLLLAGRVLGEIAGRLRQPPVLGEILAGILLGPTILGRLAPGVVERLFPAEGPLAVAREGLATFAVVLFLFVAGMEVDLSTLWRRGRAAISVSLAGIVVPFGLGLAAAAALPDALGWEAGTSRTIFVLFFATALSISALPVIARTLLDLNLYRSDMGMVVIAAAIFDDLTGWIVFAVILGLTEGSGHPVGSTIAMVLAYAALMLTVGRWLVDRLLPLIQAHLSWPSGMLGFALVAALFGAALTEWIGVHALFGAFMVGVALGDSRHLREHMRRSIGQFVSGGLAPLFFTTIGLSVDFVQHFDLLLVLLVLGIACAGKILGCAWGARVAGMARHESWAVGFGMNARGAMEIILGLVALRAGIIGERLFVALVIMALVTSVMGGPLMQRMLRRRAQRRLADVLSPRCFKSPLTATTADDAIKHLGGAMAEVLGLPVPVVQRAVLERERQQGNALGHGVAVPHARIPGLTAPVLGAGLSRDGLDFDAPDGAPVHLMFLLLVPEEDDGAQLELLAALDRIFRDPSAAERVRGLKGYTELLALLKIHEGVSGEGAAPPQQPAAVPG